MFIVFIVFLTPKYRFPKMGFFLLDFIYFFYLLDFILKNFIGV